MVIALKIKKNTELRLYWEGWCLDQRVLAAVILAMGSRPQSESKWELVAHLKCNNRIRLCCCHISMPSAVPVVVLVVVACYFGIYRVLTQSQFQPTLFAFGYCQCRLSATSLVSIAVYRWGKVGRGAGVATLSLSLFLVWANLSLSALWKMHLSVVTSCGTDK